MKRTRAMALAVTIVFGLLCASCGGGGNAIVLPGGLVALFSPGVASADPRISMAAGSAAGEIFDVEIRANGFVDLYGAAFTLIYQPGELTFLGCEAQGSILSSSPGTSNPCDDTLVGGAKFAAALENGAAGTLNVRASRDGLVPGILNGDGLLLTLTFQVNDVIGTPGSALIFEVGASREVLICPQNLDPCTMPLVPWNGGAVTATES